MLRKRGMGVHSLLCVSSLFGENSSYLNSGFGVVRGSLVFRIPFTCMHGGFLE